MKIVLVLGVLGAVCLTGCGDGPQVRTYTEVYTTPPASTGGPAEGQEQMQAEVPQLQYQLPTGWAEGEAKRMRLASFASGEDTDGSIIILPGNAGGALANARRWAGQISLEWTDAELEAFLARQERFVSVGSLPVVVLDFTPALEPAAPSMLAAIVVVGESTAFVKLTGSNEAMIAARSGFGALCRSLTQGEVVAERNTESAFRWDLPDGWEEEPGQGMRLATFRVTDDTDGLCTVVVLNGDGGGLQPNIERWARQLGITVGERASEITTELPMAHHGSLVLVDYTPLTPEDGSSMAVGVWQLAGQTVYLKLSGPVSFVRQNLPGLRELCTSLRKE